ncbi:hypothetical protein BS17DRAFT_385875 [Gyrodon lividus]|nr:hypothetical protein BS17DRAFT_385875 [Gyrodon lividus]
MACGSTTTRYYADPSVTAAQTRSVIEYRKDGAISKMRSHKGNIPVLPQTKLCPRCPAKFTRTTHLNRHLRTHTGERSHRCDVGDRRNASARYMSHTPYRPARHSLPAAIY